MCGAGSPTVTWMVRLLPGPGLQALRALVSVRATGLSSALMAASTALLCVSDGMLPKNADIADSA